MTPPFDIYIYSESEIQKLLELARTSQINIYYNTNEIITNLCRSNLKLINEIKQLKEEKQNGVEELFKIVEDLQNEILSLIEENKKLITINEDLQDEVDSLWMMMDEITKSDLENFSHILDELKADVITRTLMISKTKGEA